MHGISCRINGRKYPFTEFATIKSLIDAVKFSNTIHLSPNLYPCFSDNPDCQLPVELESSVLNDDLKYCNLCFLNDLIITKTKVQLPQAYAHSSLNLVRPLVFFDPSDLSLSFFNLG